MHFMEPVSLVGNFRRPKVTVRSAMGISAVIFIGVIRRGCAGGCSVHVLSLCQEQMCYESRGKNWGGCPSYLVVLGQGSNGILEAGSACTYASAKERTVTWPAEIQFQKGSLRDGGYKAALRPPSLSAQAISGWGFTQQRPVHPQPGGRKPGLQV